ncbi:MAG: elongation factor G [Dehalococcoidia bacterium]
MKSYETKDIRNVVLLAHAGSGKTSLTEAMLYRAGAINRQGKVEEGNTASDFDPDEIKRHISINTAVLPLEWKDTKVNLIDTPGYQDFVGDTLCGIASADAAIIVVDASSGVQVGTEQVWSYCEDARLPRVVFVSRMDRENANYAEVIAQLEKAFGKKCAPLQMPIGSAHNFSGVVDILHGKAFMGDSADDAPVPPEMAAEIEGFRDQLLGAIAETDDALTEKYLEGEDLTDDELRIGLSSGVLSGALVPVLVGSASSGVGVRCLLDFIVEELPTPETHPVSVEDPKNGAAPTIAEARSDGPLVAQIFKTTADPYVGKLTYFRVYSGTFRSNSEVWNASRNQAERIGQVYLMRGKNQEPVEKVVAGDIGAVAKLAHALTSDTLTTKDRPLVVSPINFPKAIYSVAILPKSKADVDKLSNAMARMSEEDPTLDVHRDESTGDTIIGGIGDSHIDVTVERMKRKFGVEVSLATPHVPYRETVSKAVKSVEYTHKKQTGGHGQYAKVVIDLSPLPGEGFKFENKTFGGSVPRNFVPAVEKGVNEALHEGVIARYPMVDLKVDLVDGKEHPVDSSEMAFKLAGSQAFKQAAALAQPVLLEPIMNLQVRVPEAYVGDIISDLNTKRARVLGTNPEGNSTVIDAQAPLAEILRYSTDLRSITQGRASYTMEFDHYAQVPDHVAKKVVEGSKQEAAAKT